MTTLEWDLTVGNALGECAVARGGSRDAVEAEVYLRRLQDLDADLVRRALDELANEPRREYESVVPPVPTIRQRVAQIARRDAEHEAQKRLAPLPAEEADPRTWVYCQECRDEASAWREFFCPGNGSQKDPAKRPYRLSVPVYPCSRKKLHGPHPYVERCACYATNPVIAKRREAQARPQAGERVSPEGAR